MLEERARLRFEIYSLLNGIFDHNIYEFINRFEIKFMRPWSIPEINFVKFILDNMKLYDVINQN